MLHFINNQAIQVVHKDDDATLATWGPLFLSSWNGLIDNSKMKKIIFLLKKFSSTQQSGVGLITIIKEKTPIPSAETRKTMAAALEEINIIVSTGIMEGKGFRASAVLGFTAGLMLLSKHKYPNKIFGSVDDCVKWFHKTLEQRCSTITINQDTITKVIERFREIS